MTQLTNGTPLTDDQMASRVLAQLLLGPVDYGEGQKLARSVTVYRVEMPNKRGPYNSGLPNSREIYERLAAQEDGFCCCNLEGLNRAQCGVSDRSFRKAHGVAAYGCDSMDSIYKWFPLKARKYLQGLGAVIVRYRIPVGEYLATCGNGEVLFNPNKARRMEVLPIATVE